jgi:hypothetical protein
MYLDGNTKRIKPLLSKIDIMYPTKINSEKPLSNKIMTTLLQDIPDNSRPSRKLQEIIGGLDYKRM